MSNRKYNILIYNMRMLMRACCCWQVRETIGGEPFKGPDDVLLNMTVDEVQQWYLEGSDQHPFHMHVNHMQFVEVDGPPLVPGWNHVGDWIDTVSSE